MVILIFLGTDFYEELEITNASFNVVMGAAVLHMQGNMLTPQPVDSDIGTLLWNGEVFSGGILIPPNKSDTETISNLLDSLPDSGSFLNDLHSTILSKIEGPYSFIYYRKLTKKLYYCRDIFGRRSLLRYLHSGTLLLCSVIITNNVLFEEVPVNSIFEVDLLSLQMTEYTRPNPFPLSPIFPTLPISYYDQKCLLLLEEAVKIRVSCNSKGGSNIALLFSGGLDSTLLALLIDKVLQPGINIELINVSFISTDNTFATPDRLSAIESLSELKNLSPLRNWIFSAIDIPMDTYQNNRSRILSLISPANTAMDLSIAAPFWFAATWSSVIILIFLL